MDNIYATPAPIVQRATTEELLALAQGARRALDPTVFDEYPPRFWQAEISSSRLDSYGTRMRPSTLKNFAQDAEAGVSFQNSHNVYEPGLGRSLTGKYVGAQGNGISKTLADFYTVQGLPDTDAFLVRLRAGIAKDVSVGFYGGQFICSICERDMLKDWECFHLPLFEYPIKDEKGKVISTVIAEAGIENARLAEVSTVYEGATPGAAVLKAYQEADGGRMRPETARVIEARYRIKLPGAQHVWTGADLHKEERMAEENDGRQEQERAPEAQLVGGVEAQAPAPAPEAAPAAPPAQANPEGERALAALAELRSLVPNTGAPAELSPLEAMRWLAQENARLRPMADDGLAYRKDLIAEALTEGARANGEGFAVESYRSLLQQADLATIKRMRDDWRAIGDKQFQGGRATKDTTEEEPKQEQTAKRKHPAAAYG
jgi:hypothetical protein